MPPSAAISRPGSEFNDFLFALVGEDCNGMPLSVVSMLARRDLDPWAEAASLADLPADSAARKLASWLDALPDPALKQAGPDSMAVRLIALLPRRRPSNIRQPAQTAGVLPTAHPRSHMNAILIATYVILSLGIQFIAARREAQVCTDAAHTSAPGTNLSQTSPTSSGK